MYDHRVLSSGLREILLSVIAGSCTPRQLNSFVAVCHTLAASLLAGKQTTGTLCRVSGMGVRDIAYDCIAELFHRDVNGRYLQIHSYFCGLPLTSARDEEILAHLRRLVFSKVNHGIYRLYGEADPSLAKILRNIKLALQSLRSFTEIERFGEPCIVPSVCDPLEQKPAIDRDVFEKEIGKRVKGHEYIPEILGKLALFLREQKEHSRIVPVFTVALIIRSVFVQKQELAEFVVDTGNSAREDEILGIIRDVCRDIRANVARKYVAKGKASEEMLGMYLEVIEARLCDTFLGGDRMNGSLYESLKRLSPDLTEEAYRKGHRHQFEYLIKLARKEAAKRLKELC